MNRSILRRLRWAMMGFGLAMGLVFPIYANFFVEWKEGMFPLFAAGAVGAGITVGLANSWFVKAILVPQLEKISIMANAMARGDVATRMDIESDDRIGEIASDLNRSFDQLSRLLELVQRSGEALARLAERAEVASEVVARRTSEVDDQAREANALTLGVNDRVQAVAQAIDDVAERTATAGEKATSAQTEISAARAVLDGSQRRVSLVDEASRTIVTASESIAERTDGARGIAQAAVALVHGSRAATIDAADAARRATEASSAIDLLSDHARLVSVNASIEAAAAGAEGRAFAVVAREINGIAVRTKDLSSRVRGNLDRLVELTEAVRDEGDVVKTAIGDTGEALDAIAAEAVSQRLATESHAEHLASISREMGDVVGQIRRTTGHLDAMVASIIAASSGVAEVCAATRTVADDTAQVAHRITRISAAMADTASSSVELNDVVVEIAAVSRDLRSMLASIGGRPCDEVLAPPANPPPIAVTTSRPPYSSGLAAQAPRTASARPLI